MKFVLRSLCLKNGYVDKPINKKKITIARFAIRTLAISASTLALFDFLKGEYQDGGLLALGWLTIVIGEKRMFAGEKTNEENKENTDC